MSVAIFIKELQQLCAKHEVMMMDDPEIRIVDMTDRVDILSQNLSPCGRHLNQYVEVRPQTVCRIRLDLETRQIGDVGRRESRKL